MTERFCRRPGCRTFFDKRVHACPKCGEEPYPTNEALLSQRWASALNAKAERALREG